MPGHFELKLAPDAAAQGSSARPELSIKVKVVFPSLFSMLLHALTGGQGEGALLAGTAPLSLPPNAFSLHPLCRLFCAHMCLLLLERDRLEAALRAATNRVFLATRQIEQGF